jgi:hypothetical protein
MIEKSELFAALQELSRRHPEWRFGQLVANVAGWADEEIWDVEDQRMLDAVTAQLRAEAARSGEVHV